MWWNHQLKRIHAITKERALGDVRAAQQAAEVGEGHIFLLLTMPNVLLRFEFTEIVVIGAGEEQKEYLVHKSVLTTSSSKFLNRMLSRDWGESLARNDFHFPRHGLGSQPCNQATIFLVVDSMVEAKAPQPTICQLRD